METKVLKKELGEKLKTAMPILVFMPVYMVWFKILELVPFKFCYRTDLWIDGSFPFIKYFIMPYFVWFAFIPFVAVYLLFKDEDEFRLFQNMMIGGMIIFLILNTFFPTAISLRPAYVTGSDIFSRLVRYLYSIDTATNVFPSIHVYTTVVAFASMMQCRGRLANNIFFRLAEGVLCVSIILATIFLRQHSLLDVASGFLMGMGMNYIITRHITRDATKYCEVVD